MVAVLTFLHVLICILLCVVVLMQSSKGDGLSGAFGGGGGLPQQMFGSRGMTTALHKATIYLATGFFLTSALLFIAGGRGDAGRNKDVVGEARRQGRLPAAEAAPLTPLPGTDSGDAAGQATEAVSGQQQGGGGTQQQDGGGQQ